MHGRKSIRYEKLAKMDLKRNQIGESNEVLSTSVANAELLKSVHGLYIFMVHEMSHVLKVIVILLYVSESSFHKK